MPGPMGEKCEDCYWGECITATLKQGQISDLRCHNTVVMKNLGLEYLYKKWWCEHFEDREKRVQAIKDMRDLLEICCGTDDKLKGKGKVN